MSLDSLIWFQHQDGRIIPTVHTVCREHLAAPADSKTSDRTAHKTHLSHARVNYSCLHSSLTYVRAAAAAAASLSAANIVCIAGLLMQRSHQALTALRLRMTSPYPHMKSLWISGM